MARNILMWGDTNTNGLAHAVGQVAQATQGLSQANADITKIAENITNLGNDISKKFSERREKQLTQYANNLFNEALQGSLTSDGRVDMQKLTTNVKSIRERDKANGEFWKDEEVGNIIGQNIIKNLDSIAKNQENRRSNKAQEGLQQQDINIDNLSATSKILGDIDKQYFDTVRDFSVAIEEAKKYGVDPAVIKEITDKVDKVMKAYKLNNFSATDPNAVSQLQQTINTRQNGIREILGYITQLNAFKE